MKEDRQYTTQQMAFLEALYTPEVAGNLRKAMKQAGYGDNTPVSQVVKSLKDEIIELSKEYLAAHSAKASVAIVSVLDDPSALGTPNLIKAAESILNRAGVGSKDGSLELNVPDGGLVILPAKNVRPKDVVKENED